MKRTVEDEAFGIAFGRELAVQYANAKDRQVSDEDFAYSIGVTRPQLNRYITGQVTPGVRTVALAYREYKINVAYAGIVLGSGRRSTRRGQKPPPEQLVLPVTLCGNTIGQSVSLRLKPIGMKDFEISLRVSRTA